MHIGWEVNITVDSLILLEFTSTNFMEVSFRICWCLESLITFLTNEISDFLMNYSAMSLQIRWRNKLFLTKFTRMSTFVIMSVSNMGFQSVVVFEWFTADVATCPEIPLIKTVLKKQNPNLLSVYSKLTIFGSHELFGDVSKHWISISKHMDNIHIYNQVSLSSV